MELFCLSLSIQHKLLVHKSLSQFINNNNNNKPQTILPDWNVLYPVSWKIGVSVIRVIRLLLTTKREMPQLRQLVLFFVLGILGNDCTSLQKYIEPFVSFALDKKTLGTSKSDFFKRNLVCNNFEFTVLNQLFDLFSKTMEMALESKNISPGQWNQLIGKFKFIKQFE